MTVERLQILTRPRGCDNMNLVGNEGGEQVQGLVYILEKIMGDKKLGLNP